MPTFKYEAMDTQRRRGQGLRSTPATEEEAQQMIRQNGLLRHQDRREGQDGQEGHDEEGRPAAGRRARSSPSAGSRPSSSAPSRASSRPAGRRPAGPAQPADPRGPVKPGVLKNALIDIVEDIEIGQTLSRGVRQAPQGFDRLYVQHDQGRRGRRCPRSRSSSAWPSSRRSRRRLKRRIKAAMVYPVVVIFVACVIVGFIMILHHPQVREDLQGLQHAAARHDRCS